MADAELLYKLTSADTVPEDAWKTRNGWTGAFVEKGKAFISLQTAEQLAGVAEASFAGRADVKLLIFVVEKLKDEADIAIKFEAAESEKGGSGEFAHAFGGPLPYACLKSEPVTLELADGKHVFPLMGSLGGDGLEIKGNDDASDATATDDGMEAFDQGRFDEDDDGADY